MDAEETDSIDENMNFEHLMLTESGEFVQKLLPPPVKSFHSREELLEYVRMFSLSQGYATTIRDSEREKYVTIGCDRGGTYRNRMNTPIEERKRKTSSQLINCPFRIKGVKLVDGSWILRIVNEMHNHNSSSDIAGHPYLRRFSSDETLRIKEIIKSGIPPRQILTSLRQANPNLKAVSRTVYNAQAKIRREELQGRTPIQALLEELSKGGFTHDIKCDAENRLTHLFFAHPQSVTLSRSYSSVFVMDCTYKTNKFGMPLLDIIGVSSFNTSFYSCFAFLSKEEEIDYCWALNRFKKILGGNEPIVIVSDRELALMNAIKVVFPRTANLLCFWHIETNIIAKCKGHFEKAEDWTTFLEQWGDIVESDSISLFNELWEGFEFSYKEKPIVVNYIKSTWLPFKEHFVKAWADAYLHFGNRVTSRAEGAHAVLKKYLQVSTGNLKVTTERICLAVENNHHEIKTRLAREKIITPHNICVPFFKEIFHCVSVFAIEKLFQQYKYALVDSPLSACKGHFYSSMGLPCAHMMRGMKDRVLLISDIHPQWRIDKRSIEDGDAETTNGKDKLHDLFEELEHNYQQWPIAQQEITQKQLSQIINLSAPIVFDPIVHPHRGCPSKSKTKKTSSSTRRDPSAFEIVDKSRKCSTCKEVGHNSRTCPRGVRGDNTNFSSLVSNPVERIL